jgi:hypothetical protein
MFKAMLMDVGGTQNRMLLLQKLKNIFLVEIGSFITTKKMILSQILNDIRRFLCVE